MSWLGDHIFEILWVHSLPVIFREVYLTADVLAFWFLQYFCSMFPKVVSVLCVVFTLQTYQLGFCLRSVVFHTFNKLWISVMIF